MNDHCVTPDTRQDSFMITVIALGAVHLQLCWAVRAEPRSVCFFLVGGDGDSVVEDLGAERDCSAMCLVLPLLWLCKSAESNVSFWTRQERGSRFITFRNQIHFPQSEVLHWYSTH